MYITHPNSGLHFEKRCQMPKTEEVIHKTGIKKLCFWIYTKKRQFNPPKSCSSDGCYGCQYGYKVMDTISHSHGIQLFLYSQGNLRVAELRSICHEFELNIFWINTAFTFSVT